MPLALIVIAFKIWMLIDAVQRRADYYWLMIIAFIPGGSLIYFFLVRLRDPDARRISSRLREVVSRPVPLEVLQARFEDSRSAVNEIALAQALGENERWQEASEHFGNVLRSRPKEPDALFGYGISLLETKRPGEAVEAFTRLLEEHATYRDYAVYPELNAAYQRLDRPQQAVKVLRDLYRQSPRLRHAVWLAEALFILEEGSEANQILQTALRRHEESPTHVKKADRKWKRQALQMI
jgi:hypothetical protein